VDPRPKNTEKPIEKPIENPIATTENVTATNTPP
jgi:hypothetical protein